MIQPLQAEKLSLRDIPVKGEFLLSVFQSVGAEKILLRLQPAARLNACRFRTAVFGCSTAIMDGPFLVL